MGLGYTRRPFTNYKTFSGPTRMQSKFPGWCGKCGQHFDAGTEIWYERGTKPTHVTCPARTTVEPTAPRIAIEDAGVYVMPDGAIVKVQANKAKTRTYALRWTEHPERSLVGGGRVRGDYDFEQGLVAKVATHGRRMNLEEAKAFLVKYGQCARCSRQLVAAKSVEDGIGPVCKTYFSGGVTGAQLLAG